MSEEDTGWPASSCKSTKLDEGLAPLARLATGSETGMRDTDGRFLSGNNGGGRKKGSRNRLTETFLTAVEIDFADHGTEALTQLRVNDPATYLRIVASLVPRDLVMRREQEPDFSDMTDNELAELFGRTYRNRQIRKDLAALTR